MINQIEIYYLYLLAAKLPTADCPLPTADYIFQLGYDLA
jgi:hypothetical protein